MIQNRGFSLLEVIIATVLFSGVMAMCFSIAAKSTFSYKEMIREGKLTDVAEKTIKIMQEDLADATQLAATTVTTGGLTFSNAEIRFKVPVQFVSAIDNPRGYAVSIGNQDPLTNPTFSDDLNFRLKYGWRDRNRTVSNKDITVGPNLLPLQGPGLNTDSERPADLTMVAGRTPDGLISFRFQADPNVRMGRMGTGGKFLESQEKIDIDGDGQFNSEYIIGYIERAIYIGPSGSEQILQSSRIAICDSCILQPFPPPSTAATNSATASAMKTNNLFFPTPGNIARIEIFIWVLQMGHDGQPHVMRCTTNEFLRNNATYVTQPTSGTGTN